MFCKEDHPSCNVDILFIRLFRFSEKKVERPLLISNKTFRYFFDLGRNYGYSPKKFDLVRVESFWNIIHVSFIGILPVTAILVHQFAQNSKVL